MAQSRLANFTLALCAWPNRVSARQKPRSLSPFPRGQPLADAINEIGREIKVGLTEPDERRLEIGQTSEMRIGHDAQRTCHHQMPAFGLGAPVPFIDQETFGIERESARVMAARSPGSRNPSDGSEGGSGRISHHTGGCAIQARTAAGVLASCNSPATVWGTSTRL